MYFRHHACSLSIAYLRCCDGDAIIHRFCVCEVVFFKLGANGRPAFLYRQNRRRYHKPVVPTGDRFVAGTEMRERAIEATHADCVEMEGAAVSQIAAKNGVPCVILRAMSDNADEDGHEVLVVKKFSISEYVATATKIVAAMVEKL